MVNQLIENADDCDATLRSSQVDCPPSARRRALLTGGLRAAAVAAVGAVAFPPRAQATTTDVIHDQGGQVFNALAYNGGAFNDTTIRAAISAAATAGGGIVFIPQGTWLISGNIDLTHDGISLIGAGTGATVLQVQSSFTGDVVTITGRNGCSVRDLAFSAQSATARTAGSAIKIAGQPASGPLPGNHVVRNVDMRYQFNGIVVTDNGSTGAWIIHIEGGDYRGFNSSGVGVWLNSNLGGAHYVRDIFMDGTSGPVALVRVQGSGDFTLIGMSVAGGAQNGLLIDPPSGNTVAAGFIAECEWDTCTNNCVTINVPSGVAEWITFSDCWITSGSANNVYIGGNVTSVGFIGCKIYHTSGSGIFLNGGGATDVFIDACDVKGCVTNGVYVSSSTQDFAVRNSRVGGTMDGFGTGTGIKIDSGCNKYLIVGNSTLNCTTSITDSGGPTKVVANNL